MYTGCTFVSLAAAVLPRPNKQNMAHTEPIEAKPEPVAGGEEEETFSRITSAVAPVSSHAFSVNEDKYPHGVSIILSLVCPGLANYVSNKHRFAIC